PFTSVFAHAQNAGQKPPAEHAPTTGKTPLGKNATESNEEVSSEQPAALVVSALSAPVLQGALTESLAQTDLVAVVDRQLQAATGEGSPVSISAPGSAGRNTSGQLHSGESSEEKFTSLAIRTQKSESPATTVGNHLDTDVEGEHKADSRVPALRQLAGPTPKGVNESRSHEQVSDELFQPRPVRGSTVSARIGEPVASLANTQTGTSTGILSLEGFTQQSQHVLSSYVTTAHSTPGVRANGVTTGAGDITAKLNSRIEIDSALKSELASSALNADNAGSQEFGLDRESSRHGYSSLSQQRAMHASGASNVFAEVLGEGSRSELGLSSRSGMIGERPVTLPSSLPQRLQMDVTLADDSRVQIDVAVQQRHVSAHLVTDQAALRNLAVQHEGQLVEKLADADLELRNFGAHLSDHSATGHQESREGLNGGGSEASGGEAFHEHQASELIAGMMSERGLHLVA
ncbi:MAG: hypothetical protein VST68_03085, partial [Nitrospirota bacterium]|nr:hypothetical protein [Nitrospirota bacterium]